MDIQVVEDKMSIMSKHTAFSISEFLSFERMGSNRNIEGQGPWRD